MCVSTQVRYDAGMRNDADRAWEALLRIHALLVPMLDAQMQAAASLQLTWYDVLLELHTGGGRLTMTELADRVVLSRTRVSRLVTDLERAGLVAREVNPDDGRSSFATITDEGRARLRSAAPTYVEGLRREISGPLSAAELRSLADSLEKVLSASRRAAGVPAPG
jgi:DNA-binding MarR family transcriptional regulator